MTRGSRAVRRPLASAIAAGALLVGLTGTLAGCAGIGQPAPYDSTGINGLVIPTPRADPADFVTGVDNPWLALEPGATWSYDVVDAGRTVGSMEAEVVDGATEVAGLSATAVTTTTDVAGSVEEETRFYAQDEDGNVWLVGVDGGRGGWRAGEDGARAGLAMPADPRLGDGWLSYAVPGLPRASTTIEERSRLMVQVLASETGEADTATRHVYEKGVGLVGVEDLGAGWSAALED